MRIKSTEIRPIPRRAVSGWMCLGVIEHSGCTYVLEVEPGGVKVDRHGLNAISHPPAVHIVEYIKMARSDDILDGDTEMIKDAEEWATIKKFAEDHGLLTKERVEGAVRLAAMKSLIPPTFEYHYECLMNDSKVAAWEAARRVGPKPFHLVTSQECWACPRQFREPCTAKLYSVFKKEEEQVYEVDTEFIGDLGGVSEEEKEKAARRKG